MINKQNGSKVAATVLTVVLAAQVVQSAGTLALCNLAPHSPPRPGCYDAITMWADLYAKAIVLFGQMSPGPDGPPPPADEGQPPPRRL